MNMRMPDSGVRACEGYEAPMEDYLEALERNDAAQPAPALAQHLAECAACRESLEDMREVTILVRGAAVRVPESLAADPYFAVRAAARARESLRQSADFWPQLESFAMRLMAGAITAALTLGAISVWGPQRIAAQGRQRLRPADSVFLSPVSNPAPGSTDDAVVTLLTSSGQRSGRQR
jgi:hypothetical protein